MTSKNMNNKIAIPEGVLSGMKWRGQAEKRRNSGNCHEFAVVLISHIF